MQKLLLPASLLLLFISCKSKKEFSFPEYKQLTEAVYASGTLEAVNQYNVFSPVSGIIENEFVQSGTRVSKGTLLFNIKSDASLKQQQSSALLRIVSASTADDAPAFSEMKLKAGNLYDKYVSDSNNYERQKDLFSHNATSAIEVEKALLELNSSRNNYKAFQSSIQKEKLTSAEKLKDAQGQYNIAANDSKNGSIVSGLNGKVYKVFKTKGEMINAMDPIAVIGDQNAFILNLMVDERDISRLATGQKVYFKTDLLADSIFVAHISKIYPYLDTDTRSVRVDAIVDSNSFNGFIGASIEANIVVTEKQLALVIPRNYLVGEDSVFIEQGGKPFRKKIKKGIETLENVEVIEGLKKEDKIYREGN